MSTLDLTGLRVAPVGDLSDVLAFKISGPTETDDAPVEVRRYAGGRDRIITRPGRSRTVPFTAVNIDRDAWLSLKDLIGTLCLFRDSRGRAIYGVMASVSGDEWRIDKTTLGDVSFTITEVSYSEVV